MCIAARNVFWHTRPCFSVYFVLRKLDNYKCHKCLLLQGTSSGIHGLAFLSTLYYEIDDLDTCVRILKTVLRIQVVQLDLAMCMYVLLQWFMYTVCLCMHVHVCGYLCRISNVMYASACV
jgi:hypothetical protein